MIISMKTLKSQLVFSYTLVCTVHKKIRNLFGGANYGKRQFF